MNGVLELFSEGLVLETLPEAFLKYGIKYVLCIVILIVGVNLGRVLRNKKDKKRG